MSELWRLKGKDFAKGAVSAVIAAIIATIYSVTTTEGFSVFTADWVAVGDLIANAGFISFVGYIGTVFMSDKEGKVLGRIG